MQTPLEFEDVRDVTAESLRSRLGAIPAGLVVVGSPVCTPFSPANTTDARGLDSPDGQLTLEWCRVVQDLRPCWAALENSPRLRAAGADRIAQEMESIGYAVWPHVVGTDDLGARHHRKRCWLIAADPRRIDLRAEPRRYGWSERGRWAQLLERHPFDPDTHGDGEPGQPEYGEMAGLVGAVAVELGEGWVRGASRYLGLLRVADGIEPRMARSLIAAIGDAVHPSITAAIGRTMRRLVGGEVFVDLFAGGVGGWSIGMEQAGFRCIAFAERDPARREFYKATRQGVNR